MEKAVIDRFEGSLAVLLVGDEQKPLTVERIVLPPDAKEGTWLRITIEKGIVTHADIDQLKTNQMAETIAEKMERLRKQGQHSGK
jgi:hypothetical protein